MYEVAFHDADPILVAENNLKDTQREIDRLRGRQLGWLKMVIRRRGIVRDGYRSLVDWTASRLDIPHTVADDLAYLARRLDDDTIDLIRLGHLSFDRTVSEQRLIQPAGREPVIMLIKDDNLSDRSGNTQGVELFNGPRVGPRTVDQVECEGRSETVTIRDGQIVGTGPPHRHVPKRLRRAVLARDRRCVIDSCKSSYRLQTHHVIPRRQGGPDTAGNLATLCWYHHHIAIHRRGQRIDPDTPPHRRRLLPPRTWPHYRHPHNVEYLDPHQQQQRAYQEYLDRYQPHIPDPGG